MGMTSSPRDNGLRGHGPRHRHERSEQHAERVRL